MEPQTSCSECSLHFPTGVDLKKHIDLAHRGRQGGKRYQCLQCAAEFDDIKSHKIHVDAHALEKPSWKGTINKVCFFKAPLPRHIILFGHLCVGTFVLGTPV